MHPGLSAALAGQTISLVGDGAFLVARLSVMVVLAAIDFADELTIGLLVALAVCYGLAGSASVFAFNGASFVVAAALMTAARVVIMYLLFALNDLVVVAMALVPSLRPVSPSSWPAACASASASASGTR